MRHVFGGAPRAIKIVQFFGSDFKIQDPKFVKIRHFHQKPQILPFFIHDRPDLPASSAFCGIQSSKIDRHFFVGKIGRICTRACILEWLWAIQNRDFHALIQNRPTICTRACIFCKIHQIIGSKFDQNWPYLERAWIFLGYASQRRQQSACRASPWDHYIQRAASRRNLIIKLIIFGYILWKFGKFEILNPNEFWKFEIPWPYTKISNLDTKILNFDDFCYAKKNFAEIDKHWLISRNLKSLTLIITKINEILNPKIQNFQFLFKHLFCSLSTN